MLSLEFDNVYINNFDATVGPNEKKGNLKKIKHVINDFYYHEPTFELCEIKMQKEVIDRLLKTCENKLPNIIVGGDLTNQIYATSYAVNKSNMSFLGLYNACSTFIEGLIIGASMIDSKKIDRVLNITSSHNLVAERQFRYPVEYGSLRNVNSTFTLTCAIGSIISNKKSVIRITDCTVGKVLEYGIDDPNQIGSIMAPSAAETIKSHLDNFNRNINYYDLVLTGDLGNVGLSILKEYLNNEYNIKCDNIIDAGANIYKNISDINDGGSGPTALPLYFFYNILSNNRYKKILLVGTGSLHSRIMVNQKKPIPAISHAISIEVKR